MAGKENVNNFSQHEVESLRHLSDLLHLFHHRNKNQHRRSVWWRHFSIFRRQLNCLVGETESLTKVPATHLERSRKKAFNKATQFKISQRLNFWQDILVPKWQNSFSQLIADRQFAVLGLVLTAILAQTCHITRITPAYDDLRQTKVEEVLEKFGQEYWNDESRQTSGPTNEGEDLGEVVTRGSYDNTPPADTLLPPISKANTDNKETQLQAGTNNDKAPRKKRKRANAIDDLFSGLG